MLSNIPQKRILLYMTLAGLLPLLFVVFTFWSKLSDVEQLENTIQEVELLHLNREKKQTLNTIVRNHYRDADHFYIDKNLETLTFLEPEIEALQKSLNQKNSAEDDQLKKRLEILTSPANQMAFSEGVVQSLPEFQETTETLTHPVEVDVENIKEILARIEGMDIGPYHPIPNRPQLIILEFKIEKKKSIDKNEIFLLNMKLLKREYL